MRIVWKICPNCLKVIMLNGAGSTSSFWNRRITWLINKLYPITQELFFEASCTHDMRYHQGSWSRDVEKDRLICDDEFHDNCKSAIQNSDKWLVKFSSRWFYYQAEKYYIAVRLGGSSSFGKCACSDPIRK